MDGIRVIEYHIFMTAYVRTAMLTCNRNLHEYLAFWSQFSYFRTIKALPTKPFVICQLFHCKCRLSGAVFKFEITLFKKYIFFHCPVLFRQMRVKFPRGLERTSCKTDFSLISALSWKGLSQICNCSMLYSLHSVSSTSVAMDWFQITLYI